MKNAIAAIFVFFSFILFGLAFLYSDVYGLSPQLKTEFLSKEIQNYIYYGPSDGFDKTLNYLQQSSDLDRVYVTSNGTHLEIKLEGICSLRLFESLDIFLFFPKYYKYYFKI